MVRLFHGCGYVNSGGTQKLIAKGHDYLVCTDKCFWKNTSDVATRIQAKSMTKNECAASLKTFNNYVKDKEKDNDII